CTEGRIEGEKPETLTSAYDEKEMDLAIEKARDRVEEFLVIFERGDADSFAIKVPITDTHGTEHFWLTDITYDDGSFTGRIGNDPGIVKGVTFGQSWTVKKGELSDWMYVRGDRIHGGFTIEALLPSFPPEQAEAIRAQLVR
ncbi:MAG: DUF2314 domain-containing protein, partial [Verrucomicrobiota bacterium]